VGAGGCEPLRLPGQPKARLPTGERPSASFRVMPIRSARMLSQARTDGEETSHITLTGWNQPLSVTASTPSIDVNQVGSKAGR
jgi:hypothetical protein